MDVHSHIELTTIVMYKRVIFRVFFYCTLLYICNGQFSAWKALPAIHTSHVLTVDKVEVGSMFYPQFPAL